jgi:hypothetical protein
MAQKQAASPCFTVRLSSFVAKRDPSAREVVWRDGHRDAIARQNTNAELAHLSSGGGENHVSVVELDAEHGARQYLGYDAFKVDACFLHIASEIWRNAPAARLKNVFERGQPCAVRAQPPSI